MIRLIVLAITAFMAVSATAATASELTVKVAGKAVPQVHADIIDAAKTVCRQDIGGTTDGEDLMPYCVRDVAQAAMYKVNSPALMAYDKANRRSAYVLKASR
jgi:hypothetical protein